MMEQKSFMSIAREGGSMATGYLIYNAIEKGELDEDLAKLGYRKVRNVRISFLDGAGFGYTNQDGCFQLLADNTEMFIPVEEK